MILKKFKEELSYYTNKSIPYLFVIDFDTNKPFVCTLDEAEKNNIYYDIKGNSNFEYIQNTDNKIDISIVNSVSKDLFCKKIKEVKKHINNGDSYLLNLCFPTEIKVNLSLKEIFNTSKAPYKLLFNDKFTVFSPECFIRIYDNEIHTYPMKGTIDATLENAENILLNNPKEQAEHNTIVDLMRNDLSIIAQNIEIVKYRYIDRIKTNKNEILQTSSDIKGKLPEGWKSNFGESLLSLLPAGSISGAPKQKTLEIINKQEIDNRGYYTGVFGVFDGKNLDSGVIIRYIEQTNDKLIFRSGGGITSQSDEEKEYEELMQKIYIPY